MGTELRRQIYPSLMRCYSCFPDNCKEKRAVHVASGVPFSCEHYNVVKSCSLPTSAKNLQEEDIKSYNSDNSTQRVIVKKSSPKNLSVDCRPTHYRQFIDRLPTAKRQATDSFPKKKIVEKTRIKHDIETIIILIDITYLPIDR